MTDASRQWWGTTGLELDRAVRWRIGALSLAAERRAREWRLAYSWDDSVDDGDAWSVDRGAQLFEVEANLERHVAASTEGELGLWPVVADRPVISSPRIPLWVGGGEQVVLYVGSPLWLRVTAEPSGSVLRELPLRRVPDTWFGSSTREGELCYATQTRARLDSENLPRRALWAITAVEIQNRAKSPLAVERLRLEVPYLSLFDGGDGTLRTERVKMVRSEDSGMARLEIVAATAEQCERLVSSPRQRATEGFLPRALSFLERLGELDDD